MDEKRNDGRGYGNIGYKLNPEETECCSIDLKSGVIRVKEGKNSTSNLLTQAPALNQEYCILTSILGAKLDREYIDQYTFNVVAMDGGGVSDEPMSETEVSVTVRLEDINDNVPKFERESYSIEFSEDAKIGKDGDTSSGKIINRS